MAEAAVANTRGARARRKKRTRLRRTLQWVWGAILILIALPLALVPLYRFVDPPVSSVMLLKALTGAGIEKSWADLDEISPRLVRAVVASEDQRFCIHKGIDWVEVRNALDDEDGRFRGASTITMQTAKNLFLWTGRSWLRKGLEAPLALYLELFLSKRRIMEIYLNIVEWDVGVYGAAAAAQHYFGTSPRNLTDLEAARLAAVLPSPEHRDAANPGPGTARIARRIAARIPMMDAETACLGP
jgi:monofunctional biosynthetic peptidoglycan transglycosylase